MQVMEPILKSSDWIRKVSSESLNYSARWWPTSSLTTQQLEYLLAIDRTATWAEAAAGVGVTPSALSQGIAELERRLGVALFERDGRRRVPTRDHAEVLRYAEQTVAATRDLARWADGRRGGRSGRVRLGLIDAAATHHCRDVLREYRDARPDVELRLTVGPSSALLAGPRAGPTSTSSCASSLRRRHRGSRSRPCSTTRWPCSRPPGTEREPTGRLGSVGDVPVGLAHPRARGRRARDARARASRSSPSRTSPRSSARWCCSASGGRCSPSPASARSTTSAWCARRSSRRRLVLARRTGHGAGPGGRRPGGRAHSTTRDYRPVMDQYASALDLAAAIRTKEVSPTEAMDDTLARIDAPQPGAERSDLARRGRRPGPGAGGHRALAASAADDARRRSTACRSRSRTSTTSPAGRTRSARTAPPPIPSPRRALPVERLVDAGFVLCGRTNSPEFGSVTATENERYGITRNPWNLDHTSGGSSGGASAAVAGGMFTIAHASDGGGSIRIPATCTGLVGLKPARGRVTDRTVSWEGASTQGVVSHTVADTAAALDAMSRFDPLAWWNAPAARAAVRRRGGSRPGPAARRVDDRRPPWGSPPIPSAPKPSARPSRRSPTPATRSSRSTSTPTSSRSSPTSARWSSAGLATNPVDWDRVQASNRASYDRAAQVDSLTYAEAIAELQLWTRDGQRAVGRATSTCW